LDECAYNLCDTVEGFAYSFADFPFLLQKKKRLDEIIKLRSRAALTYIDHELGGVGMLHSILK